MDAGPGKPGTKCYEFYLRISPEDYLDYYRGSVRHVIARTVTGQNVQFPAAWLQRFVTPQGIQGRFRLSCDLRNRGVGLDRLPG